MIKANYPIEKFEELQTPFYYYDTTVLKETLNTINNLKLPSNYEVHYALKANVNSKLLTLIKDAGMGADCVSGGEVEAAINTGFPPSKIVFAGVGKADWEINLALDNDIFCFNVESDAELEVINELAQKKNKIARVALRLNPNVSAHTHEYIKTGENENKFGINLEILDTVLQRFSVLNNVKLIGLHFHIGSQITDMTDFQNLCIKINKIQDQLDEKKISVAHINVGGGLGINYEHPNHIPIPDFETYFNTFQHYLKLKSNQTLHFELGRSIVAQCGSLITKVLYVKKGSAKNFLIVDAGMTDLVRPALYKAYHRIENLSSQEREEIYDVVGPICESSDVFDKNCHLNAAKRGDYIALRSAGAYGEIMASRYNLRKLPLSITSDEI